MLTNGLPSPFLGTVVTSRLSSKKVTGALERSLVPIARVIEYAVQRHRRPLHPCCSELVIFVAPKTRLESFTHRALRRGRWRADRGVERFGRSCKGRSTSRLVVRRRGAREHVQALDDRRLVAEPLRNYQAVAREQPCSLAIAPEERHQAEVDENRRNEQPVLELCREPEGLRKERSRQRSLAFQQSSDAEERE